MNGDHPEDNCRVITPSDGDPFLSEGNIVRYFRHPDINGEHRCERCEVIMHSHGWIDTLEGGSRVCPGDWIITGIKGENYPVKDNVFKESYDEIKEDNFC